jgi:hypothetical protein
MVVDGRFDQGSLTVPRPRNWVSELRMLARCPGEPM